MLNRKMRQLAHIGGLWLTKAKKSDVAYTGQINFPSGRVLKIQVYANQFKGNNRPDFVIYADFGDLEALEEGLAPHEYAPHPF